MTAERPGRPVTEAACSLEVRWIFPGRMGSAVAGWFGRFPAGMESREDIYLLDPQVPGLSVKIRGSGALEVKAYCGSPGILEVAGRARGRMESWQKWSFPFGPPSGDRDDTPGWMPVRKRRLISQFSSADGAAVACTPGMGQQPRCRVELTEVRARGQDWWTLGSRRAAPPICSAANLRPPPRWCSPKPRPAEWYLAQVTPGPMLSGWANGPAPAVTPRQTETP